MSLSYFFGDSSDRDNVSVILKQLELVVVIFFLANVALTLPLWLSYREYPLAPVFDLFSTLHPTVGVFFFCLNFISGIGMLLSPRHRITRVIFFFSAAALLFLDQNRLQTWVYIYLSFLLVIFMALRKEKEYQWGTLRALMVMMAAVYFWSGLQKIGSGFILEVWPWFIGPLSSFISPTNNIFSYGVLAVPFIESMLGIGLLIRATRLVAVLGIVAMHMFIIFLHNPFFFSAYPMQPSILLWNIGMMCMALVLFSGNNLLLSEWRRNFLWRPHLIFVLLFSIAPALSFVGAWDENLSFALYSSRGVRGWFVVPLSSIDRLPKRFQQEPYLHGGDDGKSAYLDIAVWSLADIKSSAIARERVYVAIGRHLCEQFDNKGSLILRSSRRTFAPAVEESYTCQALAHKR